ncbi:MAG: Gfo/Idh/MocA family protein [Jatrophihabitans sp.]
MAVQIGLIGAGVMGAEHARLLAHEVAGAAVVAVFDLDPARATATAALSGAVSVDDPMVLIKDEQVQAVLVASSDNSHEEFVLACLAAGKPVLCEKPLAPDVAGCRRIVTAELQGGRSLVSVGFMRRFDPGYLALRDGLRGGELGQALMLHCVHRNRQAPAGLASTALISGSAVHEFDASRWLLGQELTAVTVHRSRSAVQSGTTDDPMFLVAESEAGVLVDIEVFVNAGYGYEVRCELVAERGTLSLDSPAPTVLRAAASAGRELPGDWRPRFAEAYRRELQAWVSGLRTGRPHPDLASAWDGYRATALAEAGVAALGSAGREQVVLPAAPEFYRRAVL